MPDLPYIELSFHIRLQRTLFRSQSHRLEILNPTLATTWEPGPPRLTHLGLARPKKARVLPHLLHSEPPGPAVSRPGQQSKGGEGKPWWQMGLRHASAGGPAARSISCPAGTTLAAQNPFVEIRAQASATITGHSPLLFPGFPAEMTARSRLEGWRMQGDWGVPAGRLQPEAYSKAAGERKGAII